MGTRIGLRSASVGLCEIRGALVHLLSSVTAVAVAVSVSLLRRFDALLLVLARGIVDGNDGRAARGGRARPSEGAAPGAIRVGHSCAPARLAVARPAFARCAPVRIAAARSHAAIRAIWFPSKTMRIIFSGMGWREGLARFKRVVDTPPRRLAASES